MIATALGITAAYELPADRANACNWLQGSACPISANEDITATLSMPVLPIYPLVSLQIQVSVLDENDETLACFAIDARVVVA